MNRETADLVLLTTKFTRAKTMPNIPHSWTARKEWEDQELFNSIVLHIREFGIKEQFYSKTYIYYYANGFKYWTMGRVVSETIIINRALK